MKYLAYFSLIISLSGCVKPSSVTSYRIPWPDSNHEYRFQNVDITSFDEPQYLRGKFVEFFIEPSLDFDQGSITQPGLPAGRFAIDSSGASVPLDTTSMQAAVIYAHLERLHKLNQSSGADAYVPDQLSVGVNVDLIANDQTVDNNAQYNPDVNALLFVPYTDTDLPISFNAGVIGHEYFHSIFQHMVLAGLSNSPVYVNEKLDEPVRPVSPFSRGRSNNEISREQYNRFVLRGINEGLADFWGWLYSGDPSFVGRSLSNAIEARRLDRDDIQFYSLTDFKNFLSDAIDDDMRLGGSYTLGSQYAVYFHNITLKIFNGKTDEATRAKMARILILALPKLRQDLKKLLTSDYVAPEMFVKNFVTSLQESSDAPNLKSLDLCASFKSIAPQAVESSKPLSCVTGLNHDN